MSLSTRLLEISSRISQIPLSYYSTQLSSLLPKTSFSPHMHQISKLTILIFTITSVFYFTFISSHFSSSSYRTFSLTTSGRKGAFVNSFSAADINGPYDNSTLMELCRTREWKKGLIFGCEAPSIGLVESRNVMLNCLRFGIEAGATSFIIPVLRTPEDKTLPFSHLFDLDHFTSTLTASCPQINIIPHINDLWDKPSTSPPVLLSPNALHSIKPKLPLIHSTILAHPGNWSSAFKTSLNASHPRAPTEKLPVLVSLSPPPLLQFPTTYDSAPFITNFGKLVRPAPELRRLAGAVLYALSQKHNLNLLPTPEIQSGAFYGAVLSSKNLEDAETDAKEARTPLETKQSLSSTLLHAASSSHLKTIYLSVPHTPSPNLHTNLHLLETLTTHAQNLSLALETAETLLSTPSSPPSAPNESENEDEDEAETPQRQALPGFDSEYTTYTTLTPAQKEALDYEILARASLVGGGWEGSLSWGVALRRHVVASGGGGKWVLGSTSTVSTSTGSKSPGKRDGDGLEKRPVVDLKAGKSSLSATPTPTQISTAKSKARPKQKPTKSAARKPIATATSKGKGKPGVGKGKGIGKAESCFHDSLSVVFGPRGEGKVWVLGGWP